MKVKRIASLALVFLLLCFATSCDPEACGYSRVVNDTARMVLIKAYYPIETDTIEIAPFGKTDNYSACRKGSDYPPFSIFSIDFRTVDSVDVVFDQTHYIRYYQLGHQCVNKNIISGMCYEPISEKSDHYEYHITEADFQEAVAIN